MITNDNQHTPLVSRKSTIFLSPLRSTQSSGGRSVLTGNVRGESFLGQKRVHNHPVSEINGNDEGVIGARRNRRAPECSLPEAV
jgi:hypothetical protein